MTAANRAGAREEHPGSTRLLPRTHEATTISPYLQSDCVRHRHRPLSPWSSPNIFGLPRSSRLPLPGDPCVSWPSGEVEVHGCWIDWYRQRAVMNTRPVVLVLLLIVLIITSQFDWKQQIEDAADADPANARRRQQVHSKEDAVKEKILLSQEKNIQQLNELIESLQRQLLHCRGSNNTVHTTTIAATEVSEVEG